MPHGAKRRGAWSQQEVGAPADGIGVALDAKALTPRGEDLFPVLGPGIHHHGLLRIQRPRPRVEGAGRILVRCVPVASHGPGRWR